MFLLRDNNRTSRLVFVLLFFIKWPVATRAAGDEEGNGEGGESDGDAYEESDGGGNEGGGRRRGRWRRE